MKSRDELMALAEDIAKFGLTEYTTGYECEGLMVCRVDGPVVTLDDLRDICRLLAASRITGMAP